jgi:photosystem II stability/assembly factor-like uncharacterized protein
MSSVLSNTNQQQNGVYTGDFWVFDSCGGFVLEQNLQQINVGPTLPISYYDVTNAIQIKFSVRKFNDQLGIIKDECNNTVLEILNYDTQNQMLQTDSIIISTDKFLDTVNADSIVSMGSISKLYSDFNYTVMQYFGDPYGFSSIFAYNNFQANNGVFDSNTYMNLINGITFDISGSYVSDLSGYFIVNKVNEHLRYVCNNNVFLNRKNDISNGIFYDVLNGFMEGDLVFIPNGMRITMNIDIEAEMYSNMNNLGPSNLSKIDDKLNYIDPITNISKTTNYSMTNINQTVSVPILLILSNEDRFNINNFGMKWTDTTTLQYGPKYWLSISISANGEYQCAVDSNGNIYLSANYGNPKSWIIVYNIGSIPDYDLNPSLSNYVAISATGRYITATNGSEIYISNDYGDTWSMKQQMNINKIFVSISLNGKYQCVVSCGDNLYRSSDYGQTWKSFTDYESNVYNSINAFQYGAVAVSYNGQYQTIVCEEIYVSNDYGETWISRAATSDEDNLFNDRNWRGVSISSNGQYQTAIDNDGGIYTSSDYGITWNYNNSFSNNNWTSISISATGRFQTVVDSNNNALYVSNDYGNTWKQTTSPNLQHRNLLGISVSANGQYQSTIENYGGIFISNLV